MAKPVLTEPELNAKIDLRLTGLLKAKIAQDALVGERTNGYIVRKIIEKHYQEKSNDV